MTRQLSALGISFDRVAAVDAHVLGDDECLRLFVPGPLGRLSKGDIACTMSHLNVMAAFLATTESAAVILEDDVVLSPETSRWICRDDWLPPNFGVIKLERFGSAHQLVVVGEALSVGGGREVSPLLSKHSGSAAYLIDRGAAKALLHNTAERILLPIDHLLFNPNNSALAVALRPLQMIPALGYQRDEIGGISEIKGWRRRERPKGWAALQRKALRTWYEFRRAPFQVGAVLAGRARVRRVGFV